MNVEVQEELLMLLRSQQRELTELRGQIEAMQSSIMAQVDHVLSNHQEQERILHYKFSKVFTCVFTPHLLQIQTQFHNTVYIQPHKPRLMKQTERHLANSLHPWTATTHMHNKQGHLINSDGQ